MELKSMPNCCAAFVITNFGHTSTNGADINNDYKPTKDEVYNYLTQYTKIQYWNNKMLIITINDTQKKAIGSAITKAGFKRVTSFYHNAHDSLMHVYHFIDTKIKRTATGKKIKYAKTNTKQNTNS